MLGLWLPVLHDAGGLDRPFATPATIAEPRSKSPATIDPYLAAARRSMQLRDISTTKPSPLLRNSIGLSKAGDERATVSGVVETDTVAHCGPTFAGEFALTIREALAHPTRALSNEAPRRLTSPERRRLSVGILAAGTLIG